MSESDKVFAGSIPDLYDRYLVPVIFEGYARDIARRITAAAPGQVLEVAAGTGAVTRAMAASLPASVRITATDLNPPMLDQAKKRTSDARIEWKQADGQALPFPDGSFDVVACQFGAMFFPDKVQAYREARRVLKPGGTYLFNVWGKLADNVFTDVVVQAVAAMFPDDPPYFLARTPHGHYDTSRIRAQLNEAGFETIAFETVDQVSHASSASDVAIALCQGTPMRSEIEARDASRLDEATTAAAEALARRFGNGAIEGRISAIVITAKR
jgi:ubiquinone/menaquinone biosynthesis C-methylase UbiE